MARVVCWAGQELPLVCSPMRASHLTEGGTARRSTVMQQARPRSQPATAWEIRSAREAERGVAAHPPRDSRACHGEATDTSD